MSILDTVKKLGAGWYVEWRDSVLAKAKAAYHGILNAIEPEIQADVIMIGTAAEQAGLAAFRANPGDVGAIGVAIRNAAEQSAVASGRQIGADALEAVIAGVTAKVAADTSTVSATASA